MLKEDGKAWFGLGYALQSTWDVDKDETSLKECITAYQKCTSLTPGNYAAFNNWGYALHNQAKLHKGERANQLFEAAIEKYQQAITLKPDYPLAFNNYGIALANQAKQHKGEQSNQLIESALEKYQQAVTIKPDYHEVFNNWGSALADQAKQHKGEQANQLFEAAYEKYQQAINIKPDYDPALNNWGIALLDQALLSKEEKQIALHTNAEKLFLKTEELKQGSGAYNLACLASLRKQENNSKTWLFKSKEAGVLPDCDHLQSDSDLDFVRDTDWFKELLNEVCSKQVARME